MDRFAAVTAFARVVEAGSFAQAAARLDVSVSSVSRHVTDLEAHLGARLLNRTTRRLSLTESGQTFYERCVQWLADWDEAEEMLTAAAVVPRGTLRLTCSILFGARHLAPAIAEFHTRHAQLHFDVELSDRVVDLVDEGLDLAIRIGNVGGQALIAKRIGTAKVACCAAPAYLERHGTPRVPEDLSAHSCLTYEYSRERHVWSFRDRRGGAHDVMVSGPAHTNNGQMLTALAVAAMGISYEPEFIVGPEVRAGALVPILTDYRAPELEIFAVYPSRRHLSAKVRAFIDFLSARFAGDAEWALSAPSPVAPRARRRARDRSRA